MRRRGAEDQNSERSKRKADSAPPSGPPNSTQEGPSIEGLVREVEAHQLELEVQNQELRVAQIQLAESRDRYYELYDLAPVGYLTLDAESRILEANLTAADLLGVRHAELPGQLLSSFVSPADVEVLRLHLLEVIGGGKKHGRDLILEARSNGQACPTPVRIESVAIAGASGNRDECRSVLIDLSELRLAEEKNRRLTAELNQAKKMEAIGTLASGVAHDFNNLLMGLGGCADMALSSLAPDSPIREYLEEIRKAIDSGTAITRQLLAFGRERTTAPSVFELNDVVAGSKNMLERLLGEDIEVVVSMDAVDSRVRSDPAQMEQVLLNLAVNARDAMPRGGRLVIETRSGRLSDEQEGPADGPGYVVLTVSDTGMGMTEATQQRIFDPFFTTKDVGRGSGLGLATVHGIVDQAGGHIRVRSRWNEGTTFEIWLPNVQQPVTPVRVSHVVGAGEIGSGKTILLVEDDRMVRMATRFYLESDGYRVIEADCGALAVELCRDRSIHIDLLLTDVVLPGAGGGEIAREIRKLRPEIDIVHMSAHPAEWLAARGRIDPGVRAIQKPFTRDVLLARIRKVFAESKSGGGVLGAFPETDASMSASVAKEPESVGTTVLVIEDDRVVRRPLCHLLRSMGYRVIEAEDAEAALRLASKRPAPIDVLLADARLPGKSGREAAAELAVLHPGVTAILLSGSPRDIALREGLIDEQSVFVQKPVSARKLARLIEELVRSPERRSSVRPAS